MLQTKDTGSQNGYKNKTSIYAVYKRPPSDLGSQNRYRNKTHIYAVYKRPTSDLGTHTD